jgi:hypothetical protein
MDISQLQEIVVEIGLDGPREIRRPRPLDWDTWTDVARDQFIDGMLQEIIIWSVAFTVYGDGQDDAG